MNDGEIIAELRGEELSASSITRRFMPAAVQPATA
jgi:hypothetical protein